jgi:hypothetical protein
MEYSMQLKLRHLIILFLSLFIYLYLCDQFKSNEFKHSIKSFLGVNNSTTHTVYDWVENRTNQLAGLVSVSTATVANSLPVTFFIDIFIYFYFNLDHDY